MFREVLEDLYRNAKTPAQVYTITAIVIGLSLVAALGVIALFALAFALLTS